MTAVLFLALAAGFVMLFYVDGSLYDHLIAEDGPVENATSAALFVAGVLFAVAATRPWRDARARYAPAALSLLLLVAALEEISWGQRIFQLPVPEFFIKYNDQREISIHNTVQNVFSISTKWVVTVALLLYGVVIPWLLRRKTLRLGRAERYLMFPPAFLSIPIITGALFMSDALTGREEEIAELLLSLCFCIFAGHEARSARLDPEVDHRREAGAASRPMA